MERIDTPDRLFTDGDPATNTEGTIVTASWLNGVQEEIAQTIEGFGGILDPSTPNQLFRTLASAFRMPPGVIQAFAGAIPPAGWLLCDGSPVPRATYAELFATIGITYGAGNNLDTFNLPDLCGRTPVGAGQGATLSARALGSKGGEEAHALTVAEMPSHSHTYVRNGGTAPQSGSSTWVFVNETVANTGVAGGNAAHNNMPPYLAVNFIIKT